MSCNFDGPSFSCPSFSVNPAATPYLLPLVEYQLSYMRIHVGDRKLHRGDR